MNRIQRAMHDLNTWTQGKMQNFPWLVLREGDRLAEKDHSCEWRSFAYTIPPDGVVYVSCAMLDLPDTALYGVLAHEIGHELAYLKWGENHSEAQANQVVGDWLGLTLHIDSTHYLQHLSPAQIQIVQTYARRHSNPTDDPSTPARPNERIRGSRTNRKGSATTGKDVTFSDSILKGLRRKRDSHNRKHKGDPCKKVTLAQLKAVYRRGAGAFSSSHRPSVKSRNQWAMARVNAFLRMIEQGYPDNPNYTTDNDLLSCTHTTG